MLSQNKKTILITTLVIAGTTLGGAVSAQQNVVSAQQNASSAQQNVIIYDQPNTAGAKETIVKAKKTIVTTEENTFNNTQFRFPSDIAVPQIQQRPASAARAQTARQNYPMPYPAQRQRNPNIAPSYAAQRPYAPNAVRPGPGGPPPYGSPYNRPYNRGAYNQSAYNPPLFRTPNNQSPYANQYNRGPYNRGPYNQSPYNRGPYGRGPSSNSGPFKDFGMGPFNGDSAPWETWPFGSRDSFWSRKELPFDNQNPTDWFNPGDPKEGMAIMWDDLIAAPDDLGTMPGGWNVPSVSVPNPIDLEDQLEKASKEVPDLIRVYSD